MYLTRMKASSQTRQICKKYWKNYKYCLQVQIDQYRVKNTSLPCMLQVSAPVFALVGKFHCCTNYETTAPSFR